MNERILRQTKWNGRERDAQPKVYQTEVMKTEAKCNHLIHGCTLAVCINAATHTQRADTGIDWRSRSISSTQLASFVTMTGMSAPILELQV